MPIRNFSFTAAIVVFLLGSPLVVGCGLQPKGKGQLLNQESDASMKDMDEYKELVIIKIQ